MPKFNYSGHFTLQDNLTASASLKNDILSFREQLARLPTDRDDAVRSGKVDNQFVNSGAIWNEIQSTSTELWRLLRNAEWEQLKNLRIHAPIFSGFSLFHYEPSREGHKLPHEIPSDFDEKFVQNFPNPDIKCKIWERLVQHLPIQDLFVPPKFFGEIGFEYDGIIVNGDTLFYQDRMFFMSAFGILKWLDECSKISKHRTILEIGGGYGAIAFALTNRFPDARFIICDLPESLMSAGIYLKGTLPGKNIEIIDNSEKLKELSTAPPGVYLLSNHLFEELEKTKFRCDLAINTLSMAEMSAYQVEKYSKAISGMIANHGLFFEQNYDTPPLIPVKKHIAKYFKQGSEPTLEDFETIRGKITVWSNSNVGWPIDAGKF